VWPLAQWQAAFEKMHSGDIVKAILKPSGPESTTAEAATQSRPVKAPAMHAPREKAARNGRDAMST
jgi:hypothetical protein